jgi:ketosteroid isomerase-like protein
MPLATILDTAESAEEAFYEAMRTGDLEGMMAVWSTEDEVVCIHPSGARHIGLAAVRASWESVLAGGGIDIQTSQAIIHSSAVLAVHHLVEQVAIARGPVAQVLECVVTNVYIKGATGWRMVLHQGASATRASASELPVGVVLH